MNSTTNLKQTFSGTRTLVLLALCLSLFGSASPAMAQYFIPIPFVPIPSLFAHHLSSGSGHTGTRNAARSAAIREFNKGVRFQREKNYGEAAQCYRQALQIDPSMSETHSALGNALLNAGMYEDALTELETASHLLPRDASTWFLLGQCCTRLQRHDEGLSAYQRCLHLDPAGMNASFAREYVDILQHVVFSKPGTTDFTGNYLHDSDDRGRRKWATPRLAVYVADNHDVPGFVPAFDQALRESFRDWTAVSDGKIQFDFVDDPAKAQICCRWTADRNELGGGDELGITGTQFDEQGCISHADIILLTQFDEEKARPHEIIRHCKAVDLHEIGHALGLNHSSERYDIMYPRVAPWGLEHPLTYRDHNTLLALYGSSLANADALSAATPTAPAPLTNSAIVSNRRPAPISHTPRTPSVEEVMEQLSREASAANDAHNFDLAIQKLEAVHKLDPANREVVSHLGYAYENAATLAEQGRNYAQAAAMYRQAAEALKNGTDPEEADDAMAHCQDMLQRGSR